MKKLLLAAFAFVLSTPAMAAQEKYSFEKPHSQVMFNVEHMGISHSHGKFLGFDGHFIFDREAPQNSSVEVTIDTNSIEMNHDVWNEHLRSEKWLNVEKYPTMTFKSTKVDVQAEKRAIITGDLTLMGVTKPVDLQVFYNNSTKNPFSGKYMSGFTAVAAIKRSDFGMDGSLSAVGDKVNIKIEVEGICEENCPADTNE
ncbi:MAG: hypothetical protein CMH32_02400 [Micavibrio sp.]|nr:hypothetical protein [Micavibrio sp.]HCK32449.1 hypothetical protein [Rhodospirillaceae bacterium]|tara:strand:- start:512 stop:1108 length:597 start_codon:yes stop_codon:yes gene_type:complete